MKKIALLIVLLIAIASVSSNAQLAATKETTTIKCVDPPHDECVVIRGNGIDRVIYGKGTIVVTEEKKLWGEAIPGYATATNYFYNQFEESPIVSGKGMINGGVMYPLTLEGMIHIWELPGCQLFTNYQEWQNAVSGY